MLSGNKSHNADDLQKMRKEFAFLGRPAQPRVSLHPASMDPLAASGVFRESWQARWPLTSGVRKSSDHGKRTGADVPLSLEANGHGVMERIGTSSSCRRSIKRGPDTSKVSSSSTEAPELFQDTNHSSKLFAAIKPSNTHQGYLFVQAHLHTSVRSSTRGRRAVDNIRGGRRG
ncbi:hypothetical protein BC567DRAFT_219953 [Phyllosticta citribraziliensis]